MTPRTLDVSGKNGVKQGPGGFIPPSKAIPTVTEGWRSLADEEGQENALGMYEKAFLHWLLQEEFRSKSM